MRRESVFQAHGATVWRLSGVHLGAQKVLDAIHLGGVNEPTVAEGR